MHIGRRRKDVHIKIDDTEVEQVETYQYLGHTISADGDLIREIEIRTERARAKFWQNKELLRRNIALKLKN